ncbi:MAG: twin-arginine translocation pathway signal [Burkholderiales bacterium]
MRLRRLFAPLFMAAAAACAPLAPQAERPAILFVHGNGDSAALWMTTLWRFESNGYDPRLLYTIDFPDPVARATDATAQPHRSSTAEQRVALAARVEEVLRATGRTRLALVGNSRGGYAIRDYVRNGGGAAHVSAVVLGGTPNHGVFDWPETLGSEFNARGAFLTQLNAGPDEVVAGVRFMTIRSDANDKYAQPDGRFLGAPGRPTGVGTDGPALKGAENVVLKGVDHRETSFSPQAFAATWRFLTGTDPARTDVAPEANVVLDGIVSAFAGGVPTNVPVAGATVTVYEVSSQTGERLGLPALERVTGADGRWGPLRGRPDACYEFELRVPGYAITHIYRSPFPRSSRVVHLRPLQFAHGEADAGSVVSISRPRGYFGLGRDDILLDGRVPPGIPPGVPSASVAKLLLPPGPPRAVPSHFDGERITMRSWPAKEGHIAVAEFHY